MTSPPSPSDTLLALPPHRRRMVAALVWVAVAGFALAFTYRALHWFDSPSHLPDERKRADGNSGHTQIDFGGQWLMGRMIVTGNGKKLYHRQKQWEILREGFRVEDESPLQQEQGALPRFAQTRAKDDENYQHDATNLMHWSMGGNKDPRLEWKVVAGAVSAPLAQPPMGNPFAAAALEKASVDAITPEIAQKIEKPTIGGPLYPPVHAVFYIPIGLFDKPRQAYQCFQIFGTLLIPLAGLGVKVLTRGRIWWSVATLVLLLFPGTRGGMDLGQNPMITVSILIWGWALASRGYNVAGGVVWGLFAFKPVWAAAFFLVPLLMRRWRFCLAMVLTGAAFGLVTLPFVGIDSWFHWLEVGKEASELYKTNDNWIHLSRDLQGLPRRALIDFSKPDEQRNTPTINALSWALWGAVFGTTVLVYLLRGDRSKPTGLSAGFLFLGAFLSCFHFMYYDSLLAAVGLAVLFADPRPYLRPAAYQIAPPDPKPFGARMAGYANSVPLTLAALLLVVENCVSGMELEATVAYGYFASPATGPDGPLMPKMKVGTGARYPLDTYTILLLWAWCGWQLLRGRERPTS